MQVTVVQDHETLSALAAGIVAGFVHAKPEAVLGLPTGGTPKRFYQILRGLGAPLSQVRTFNLDEYVGLPANHAQSYATYMKENLFDHVAIPPEQTHIPNGQAPDLDAECARYEAAIRAAGGLDLLILGLGYNGHIGFNEPGTPWDSTTRRVALTESTRRANARFFDNEQEVPTEAITMGIGTILQAKRILLLAFGQNKSDIVESFLTGPITPEVPATALRNHPAVHVILDRAAAGQFESRNLG